MIMNSIPPCKDCTERYTACHDHCERYKTWKAGVQKANAAEREFKAQMREDFMRSEQRTNPKRKWKAGKVHGGQ